MLQLPLDRFTFLPSVLPSVLLVLVPLNLSLIRLFLFSVFRLFPPSLSLPARPRLCALFVRVDAPGGPLETVVHEGTGFLCPSTPEAFGAAIVRLARDPFMGVAMGERGRCRVKEEFSMEVNSKFFLQGSGGGCVACAEASCGRESGVLRR